MIGVRKNHTVRHTPMIWPISLRKTLRADSAQEMPRAKRPIEKIMGKIMNIFRDISYPLMRRKTVNTVMATRWFKMAVSRWVSDSSSDGNTDLVIILLCSSTAPGARLTFGLTPDSDAAAFAAACGDVSAGSHARWLDARPRDTFQIPRGTVHALSAR